MTHTYCKMKLVCCLLSCFISYAIADRTNLKIYTDLSPNNFCFRRLNATHQIGCSSSMSGDVGIVYVVDTLDDLKWVTQFGPDAPYVAVLSEQFFNFGNLTEMKESKRVAGILVLQEQRNATSSVKSFSPDDSCPNRNFGLYTDDKHPKYSSCKKGIWNPENPGLGLALEDWGMPIFLLSKDEDIVNVRKNCFEKFNKPLEDGTLRSWPLCACQLASAMHAAKDSPTCMRRSSMIPSLTHTSPLKLCDPLSSKNIVSTLFPTNSSDESAHDQQFIIVAARLDSFSMFDGIAPGADSAVTGFVTLLSVANTLTQVKEEMQPETKRNVLFAIFNGEAFGYIGSSRAVFDMQRGEFPQVADENYDQPAAISLNNISHFLEVGQLGSSDHLWVHVDPVSYSQEVKELTEMLKEEGSSRVKESSKDRPLPPASFQSFLRHSQMPGVVLTAFDDIFLDPFYNSRFDLLEDRERLVQRLVEASKVVSATVYRLATGKSSASPSLHVDASLVEQLLECYLQNSSCRLFHEIASPSKSASNPSSDPLPLYVSVLNHGYANAVTRYTRHLASYLTGDRLEGYSEENCTGSSRDRIFSYSFMAGNGSGVCVRSTVKYTLALSPAYELDDWGGAEYSTWTESVWQMTAVTIFLQPSRAHQGLVLGLGVFLLCLSFLAVYYVNKRAAVLFGVRGLVGC